MAITPRATSTGTNNNGTSTTISLPTGTTSGDLTIIAGSISTFASNPVTIPSGWTTLFNATGQFACYRLFQSGDPSSVTLTSTATTYWESCAVSYIGCDATTPIDAVASSVSHAGSSQAPPTSIGRFTGPSVQPQWTNDLLVAIFLDSYLSSAGTITLPGGFTQRVGSTAGPSVNISDRQLSSAAATGSQTATWSAGTITNVLNVGALVALHAAGDTGATRAAATMSIAGITSDFFGGTSYSTHLDYIGAQAGDLMVLAQASTAAVSSGPSGWTQQINANNTVVYTKVYVPGDANPTITTVSSANMTAALFLLRPSYGADTPTIDVTGNATGAATTVLPSLTPAGSNEYFLGICGQGVGTQATWTAATGLTTQVNSTGMNNVGPAGPNLLIQDRQNNSAATGTFSIGCSFTSATVQGFDMLVALQAGGGAAARPASAMVMA